MTRIGGAGGLESKEGGQSGVANSFICLFLFFFVCIFLFFLCYYDMNRGRWGVGVLRRRPESGVATSRGLREATATAGTPGSGSRVRAQISQCLSSQDSHEVWRF